MKYAYVSITLVYAVAFFFATTPLDFIYLMLLYAAMIMLAYITSLTLDKL